MIKLINVNFNTSCYYIIVLGGNDIFLLYQKYYEEV